MERDEALVARLARGDETALAELLRRYERPLSAFLFRHTGGRDVDDLYQETWIRVVRSAARFDAARRFSTWLFQIAINLCRDWHRRRAAETGVDPPEIGSTEDIGRAEAGIDAARLLARLPEAQREVLILRFHHDLAEEEVAEILGCPRGTVKSRMHNALARLGQIVREGEA
jgi:RNA polymerase sigma-70 factor, ECF subfamily